MSVLIVAAAAVLYRVVPLACSGDRLAIAGGGVLRLAASASCASVVPGRALALALDAEGRATVQPIAERRGAAEPVARDLRAAAEIPRSAFVFAPAAERDADQSALVTVEIDVEVPPRTPPGDDVYLSTERSGWSPSEVRMDRVDARHFRLALRLHRGARLAFRVTRGTAATLERDMQRALPPAHVITAEPNARTSVTVAAWADID